MSYLDLNSVNNIIQNFENPSIKEEKNVKFSITPEDDAAYLDAVKSGNMETAQRMVLAAAKKAMPDTKIVDKNGDSNVKIHRFASPFVFAEEIADALLTVKESIESDQKRIYSLELTEIKKLSERGSAKPDSQHYTDSVNKLQQKHEKIKQFLEKKSRKYPFLHCE